jgi:hypothetical protein
MRREADEHATPRSANEACVEHRDEHAATADLSERKHEEFSVSSSTWAERRMSFAIGINHLHWNSLQPQAGCGDAYSHTYDARRKNSEMPLRYWRSPAVSFSFRCFRRLWTEVSRPVRDRGQRSGWPDCARRRPSTCHCAGFAARSQRRERLRRRAAGRLRDFRR